MEKKKIPEKETPSNVTILEAVKLVSSGHSLRDVAKLKQISKSALQRYVKKYQSSSNDDLVFQRNLTCGLVFTNEQEAALLEYLVKASRMHYGLTTVQVRTLAFQYASALKCKLPKSWEENKVAGYDWLKGFMGRHPKLSLRSPEATSLGRATSFNKSNVDAFVHNLKSIYEQYKLAPDCIYNCDETGVSTVNTPPKVIAERGQKQVGQVTSAERGEQVTVLCTVNAIGNAVPPVFVFPRIRFKDIFLKGAPPGSLALTSKTGWMSSDLFLQSLEHIIQHTKCSKDHPILLILDNHESHVSIDVINKAKENGVILLTFPPHCSHRLQPLDVSVFSPFKSQYNRACNDWLLNNPGKTISIYSIGELVGEAYPLAMTPKNIRSGFHKTGIYPFNSEPFTEEDFLMSSVTDRPLPCAENISQPASNCFAQRDHQEEDSQPPNVQVGFPIPVQGPSAQSQEHTLQASTSNNIPLTPEDIRPFPKAPPRKATQENRGRKKGRTRILTSTPEKAAAEKLALERLAKKSTTQSSKAVRNLNKKRKKPVDWDSSEELNLPHEETDDELILSSDSDDLEVHEINWETEKVKINFDDFVLVKFCTKKSILYYVGKVQSSEFNDEVEVQFLRKKQGCWKFYFPDKRDVSIVEISDIVMKLPAPVSSGGTERIKSLFAFHINLSHYNVQ